MERRRILLESSPEHFLLKEAKAISPRGQQSLRRKKDPSEEVGGHQEEENCLTGSGVGTVKAKKSGQ